MIVTNFAYGTGPYLRSTELAIAFNDELEKAGQKRLGIVVPWVYGEQQKRVMWEEFSAHDQVHPGEILLDRELGSLLRSIFYADTTYERALEKWVALCRSISDKAHGHLSSQFAVETMTGEKQMVDGRDVKVELSRSPRIRYDVAPAYFSSFAYVAEILEQAKHAGEIAVESKLLERGVKIADWVETEQRVRCMAYPATFAFLTPREPRYADEMLVPPLVFPPKANTDNLQQGIFVTITGIPGLERLYADAKRLGIRLYSNDPDQVPGSTKALPHIIPNEKILFQFARAGWSSIWISMMCGTPLVVPEYDSEDDPEIYFNNRSVEELQLGVIYQGQTIETILKESTRIKESYERMKKEILDRWGTLDGNRYCATLFARDFLAQ